MAVVGAAVAAVVAAAVAVVRGFRATCFHSGRNSSPTSGLTPRLILLTFFPRCFCCFREQLITDIGVNPSADPPNVGNVRIKNFHSGDQVKTPGSGSRNHVILITLITLFYYVRSR